MAAPRPIAPEPGVEYSVGGIGSVTTPPHSRRLSLRARGSFLRFLTFGVSVFLWACSDDGPPNAMPALATATPSATSTSVPTATATPQPTSTPSAHRLSGHLATTSFCTSDAAGVEVRLAPLDRVLISAADGTFEFVGIPDGEYALSIGTEPFVEPVTIAGRDEIIRFCLDCPDTLTIAPRSGPAGSTVTVTGAGCYALHSGRFANIYFDDGIVAQVGGSQIGDYHGTFVVPADAAPGPHSVQLVHTPSEGGVLETTQFIVTAD